MDFSYEASEEIEGMQWPNDYRWVPLFQIYLFDSQNTILYAAENC